MPNQFLMDFMVARAARNNPAFAHQLIRSQEEASALKNAQSLSKVLIDAIGSNPTGPAQNRLPQLPLEKLAPSPAAYSGPFANEINQAAQESGLSPAEIAAVARRESNFNPNARSPTGPQGLMQLSQAAAQDVGIDPNKRFDPLTNLIGGAKYLAKMKQEFGDDAYLAYHDGPGAVRSGNISDAGRQYQEQLRQDMASKQANPESVGSPEYTDTSKFLPNPMSGGAGLLGQDMDSVRRAYFEHLKQVAQAGTPDAIAYVMKGLEDMRNAHMADIQRSNLQKEMALTNRIPGSREYADLVEKAIVKPSTQINMGPNGDTFTPLTQEQHQKLYNRPLPQDGPTPYVSNRTGEIKMPPTNSNTEEQAKSYQYAAGLSHSLNNLTGLMKDRDRNPIASGSNAKDFTGTVLERTEIPGIATAGIAMQSEKEQLINQASMEAKTNVIHALTGGGYGLQEADEKAAAYIPQWGESPEKWMAKKKSLLNELKALEHRAGSASTQILRDSIADLEKDIGNDSQSSDFESYYNSLPSGAQYKAPDGRMRIKR